MATKDRARALRKESTDAERVLWRHLRDRNLGGHKFRRQRPFDPYVVDFVCMKQELIVELDGGQHAVESARDTARTARLETGGYRVLRFWNHEVLGNTEGVLHSILEALEEK